MLFVWQVAGGIAVLGGLLFLSTGLGARCPRWRSAFPVGAVAATVVGALLIPDLVSTGRAFEDARDRNAVLAPGQAATLGGDVLGVDVAFVEWVRGHLERDESFYLVSDGNPATVQWVTYRLLPNLAVDEPACANVIVFYGVPPRKADLGGLALGSVREFRPRFAVARTDRAC